MRGWPISYAINNFTSYIMIKFLRDENIFQFGPQKRIMSDSATEFLSAAVQIFTRRNKEWRGRQFCAGLQWIMGGQKG